jgi:hypothetical protein
VATAAMSSIEDPYVSIYSFDDGNSRSLRGVHC